MSSPLSFDVLTHLCSLLPPDERMLYRLNRQLKDFIETSLSKQSEGFLYDLLHQAPTSILLLQLRADSSLCNSFQDLPISNGVLSLPPLLCTGSPRLMKLLVDFGADLSVKVPFVCPFGVVVQMIAERRWKGISVVCYPNERRDLSDYAAIAPRHNLLTLLSLQTSQRENLYSCESAPFLEIPKGFKPLTVIFKGRETLLDYYQGRGFLLASCVLYSGTAFSSLPNVIVRDEYRRASTGIPAVTILFSRYDIRSSDIHKNDEFLLDRRDRLFDDYLTLINREGKCYHLQCPPALKEMYEEGVRLAYTVFA